MSEKATTLDQLGQIAAWESGELYPDHDTFSFGHGFGTAIVEEFDRMKAALILLYGVHVETVMDTEEDERLRHEMLKTARGLVPWLEGAEGE